MSRMKLKSGRLWCTFATNEMSLNGPRIITFFQNCDGFLRRSCRMIRTSSGVFRFFLSSGSAQCFLVGGGGAESSGSDSEKKIERFIDFSGDSCLKTQFSCSTTAFPPLSVPALCTPLGIASLHVFLPLPFLYLFLWNSSGNLKSWSKIMGKNAQLTEKHTQYRETITENAGNPVKID